MSLSIIMLLYCLEMKKLFIIVSFVFVVGISLYAQQPPKRVAILETVDKFDQVEYGKEFQLRAYITDAVNKTSGYEGYDRVDMSQISKEHDFQRTGMVSDEDIRKLGEMTGAGSIVVAEAAFYDQDQYIIAAKIINVESGLIENSTRPIVARVKANDMERACKDLVAELLGTFSSSENIASDGSKGNNYATGRDFTETAFGLNMRMVYVEGGVFTMGCTSEQRGDCYDRELPNRRTTVNSFYMGTFEVTQSQWEKVMGTTIYQQKAKAGASNTYGTGADYPMYYVSWEEAKEFCMRLSQQTGKIYRLPTEAEWEYAARGGNKNEGAKYSGGWNVDDVAWYDGNSGGSTHVCGTKRANALGIYDMSGNVYEWCEDWYGRYLSDDTNNPRGVSSGQNRVLRGGGWRFNAKSCRVSSRFDNSPNYRSHNLGFRVIFAP